MSKRRDVYVIEDEPAPDRALQRFIVDPMWPLLATMMAGVWLGWPWLLLNARALGSPNAARQTRLLAVGLAGSAALAVVIVALYVRGWLPPGPAVELALLAVTVWKLAISYKVHALQLGTFELYRYYYGGVVAGGVVPLMIGMYVGRALVLGLVDSDVWRIIVSGGLAP